jgi:ribosomal protein L11 methyltransferase
MRVAAEAVPRAEALLELAGAESVLLGDAGDDPVLEPLPDETPLWPNVVVRALFAESVDLNALCRVLRDTCAPAGEIEIAELDEADWLNAARQQFAARAIGKRLWLAPAGADPGPSERNTVRLHMGLAFGTGEHPTTELCLEWLDAHLAAGATVLDYGCGSGVLAIAAIALGARHAWAVDHDTQALTATAENARLNGVEARIDIHSPETLPAVKADVVVANILAGPLERLAPAFAKHLPAGGAVVLAGILERQVERVVSAYEPYFEHLTSTAHAGWARLEGERRS